MIRPVMTTLYNLKRVYWRIRRPVLIGVRIAPLRGTDEALLLRHTYLTGWFLPGGGADAGETLQTAALREMSEEVDLHADTDPELVALETVFKDGKTDHVALFSVPVEGEPTVDGFEICEARYFRFDALPEDISPLTRRHLALVRRQQQTPQTPAPQQP